ncbi:MAG: N-6 DNA methylase, partial [Treponema sp.]|nr:N-6 DNA methylase [Treponema sp.]
MARNTLYFLSSDTLTLEGSFFTADFLEKAAKGIAAKQTREDYNLPRGWRFIDEYSKVFKTALEIWKDLKKDSTSRNEAVTLIEEFFKDVLGYHEITKTSPVLITDRVYPITHIAAIHDGGAVPLVIAPDAASLDESLPQYSPQNGGSRKKSPFHLLQEFLNVSAYSWGIAANGKTIRLLRKSASLARPGFLQFDLAVILEEQRFAEFQMLWRILHVSRAPVWEEWKRLGEDEGTRVREGLRRGVTAGLIELGSGFLEGPGEGNKKIRDSLYDGSLSREAYFQELLRLMYRFLFLITVEERQLVFEHGLSEDPGVEIRQAQELYRSGYSLSRLRYRAAKHSGFDEYGDQWEGIKIVFRALQSGEALLDLPALGGLFNTDQCPRLDGSALSNRRLLQTMVHLRWTVDNGVRTLVDYRNMGPEELGSVYESLLELVPKIDPQNRFFSFIGFNTEQPQTKKKGKAKGNTRKTTGSYYTNDGLVQILIKNNLDPLIGERLANAGNVGVDREKRVKALLDITVIDPSCGSGHFLLAASRHLAEHLARERSDDGAVGAEDYRHAQREVISRSIYGVDLNPLAVELARMALWLEGYEPGKPLSFLDHHIRCGNSLAGIMDFDVLEQGIPEDAYKTLSGDDKVFAKKLKKRNQEEVSPKTRKQRLLFEDTPLVKARAALTQYHWRIETITNDTLESVELKRDAFDKLLASAEYRQLKKTCDLYVAAFYAAKKEDGPSIPTTADLDRALEGLEESPYSPLVNAYAAQIAEERHNLFFHWPLEFPEVFTKNGFDCVLGNPPWERLKLQEKEFFAVRYPEIAEAKNKAVRDRLIKELVEGDEQDKDLYRDFINARHAAEAASVFAHVKKDDGGRYPLTGRGDVNMYALFAETMLRLGNKSSRAGFIVPSGIATDDSTKDYFAHITKEKKLAAFYDFENREKIFPDIDSRIKFCLLGLSFDVSSADLACFITNVRQLEEDERHFALTGEEFALINPNTKTCPIFRSKKDAEITKKVYRHVSVLINEAEGEKGNPWNIRFQAMFHMSNDSGLFKNSPDSSGLPLYEAKMIHQFDHRWATFDSAAGIPISDPENDDDEGARDVTPAEKQDSGYSVTPRYWVEKRQVIARLADAPDKLVKAWLDRNRKKVKEALSLCVMDKELRQLSRAKFSDSEALFLALEELLEKRCPRWLMGWRDITNATNQRTDIASVIPKSAVNDKFLLMFARIEDRKLLACLLADQNSLAHDYSARQKIGGTDLKYHQKKQLPILPPSAYSQADIDYIVPRVLELTYTAVDMETW